MRTVRDVRVLVARRVDVLELAVLPLEQEQVAVLGQAFVVELVATLDGLHGLVGRATPESAAAP
jgi:hypothetical protein